jgi:hypothetical protein
MAEKDRKVRKIKQFSLHEAKTALAEARRLNPKLTVKWLQSIAPNIPALDGLRKAGLPEE